LGILRISRKIPFKFENKKGAKVQSKSSKFQISKNAKNDATKIKIKNSNPPDKKCHKKFSNRNSLKTNDEYKIRQ
jgi:hypothetical protein